MGGRERGGGGGGFQALLGGLGGFRVGFSRPTGLAGMRVVFWIFRLCWGA